MKISEPGRRDIKDIIWLDILKIVANSRPITFPKNKCHFDYRLQTAANLKYFTLAILKQDYILSQTADCELQTAANLKYWAIIKSPPQLIAMLIIFCLLRLSNHLICSRGSNMLTWKVSCAHLWFPRFSWGVACLATCHSWHNLTLSFPLWFLWKTVNQWLHRTSSQ